MTDKPTPPELSVSDASGDTDRSLIDVQKPDRDAYPAASVRDFACAIRRARDTESFTRHVCGRYTSFRTWVEQTPAEQPGTPTQVICVQACERDIICTIPCERVDEILDMLPAGTPDEGA